MSDQALWEEKGRWLFAQECDFVAGAATIDILPPPSYPEIAFVGRSNVGKSSLLNALTSRKTLARVSHTPGRTAQINFFMLGKTLMLVDLPGYGYAKKSKKEIEGWSYLIMDYLRGRPNLRRVCLLIDARHGIKDSDKEVMEILDEDAVSYQIVLTKCDKASGKELEKHQADIEKLFTSHPALCNSVIATSSHGRSGLEQLRAEITSLIMG
jgi:GTP-binding protein